jgi:hypothetical protein
MSMQETAPERVETPIVEMQVPDAPDKLQSVREAARLLSQHRVNKRAEAAAAPPEAAPTPVEDSPPQEVEETAPAEEPISETQAPDPVEDTPPTVEPPRSWTNEDKEAFKTLPRHTQERLVDIDRARELEVRRGQNEVAEKLKAYEQEQKALSEIRAQYESQLPIQAQLIQQQIMSEFSDIKSGEDELRLSQEDPLRYIQYGARKDQLRAAVSQIQEAQARQQQEQMSQWEQFAANQDKLFAEAVPEITDPERGTKLRQSAIDTLKGAGYTEDELRQLWNTPIFRDHRMQKLLVEATKVRVAREKQRTAPPKPVPPVQKPGTARAPSAELESQIKTLESKLEHSRGNEALRVAAALTSARRKLAG